MGCIRDRARPLAHQAAGRRGGRARCRADARGTARETTQWTGVLMSKAAGLSVSSVQQIWRAHGLQPHRMRQFKLSNDPRFVDKFCATSSSSMSIRPHTPSSCRSMKRARVRALDRTQPGLPLKKGRAGTMTHDYVRHVDGTTLFAAMNVLDGTVIGRNMCSAIAIGSLFASSMSSRSRFP